MRDGRPWICLLLMVWSAGARGQQIHRQSFEDKQPILKLGLTDGQILLLDQSLATEPDLVHQGKQSERIAVRITSGAFAYVEYPLPKALVFDELTISAWINATKPGTTLAARVVLPRVLDEKTKAPATTLLRGDKYDGVGRWRRLMLKNIDKLLEKQQTLLQAQRQGPVDIRGAYVDMVQLDIHSGIGDVEVRIDDLQAGPIITPPVDPKATPTPNSQSMPIALRTEDGQVPDAKTPTIKDRRDKNQAMVVGEQLRVGGRPMLMIGIRRQDAPLELLREAGLNTVLAREDQAFALAEEADRLGLFVAPVLSPAGDRQRLVSVSTLRSTNVGVSGKPLAIVLDGDLDRSRAPMIESAVAAVRASAPTDPRPITGRVVEDYRPYSRRLDLILAERSPVMTSLEFSQYQRWLAQRRNLARPATLFWTGVQTHVSEDYGRLVQGHGLDQSYLAPLGPQPEHLITQACCALASGYRGLIYSSDRFLSDKTLGRERLLQTAMLNLQLSLIEPFLAGGFPPVRIKTSHPQVDAVVFRHERGVLVMTYYLEPSGQFVPGQCSVNDLQLIVENAAEAAQAFQITLGEVRGLKRQKDLGGVRISIPEFDTSAFVVLTTDVSLFAHYQSLVTKSAPQSAAWSRELAELHLAHTLTVNARLESAGHASKVSRQLLDEAERFLADGRAAGQRADHRTAFAMSERCRRAARALRRDLWKEAVKDLSSPVVDPFAVSFDTLVEFHEFRSAIKRASFRDNKLPTGDFEREGRLDEVGWQYNVRLSSDLDGAATLVGEQPHGGRRSLELKVSAKQGPPPALVDGAELEMVSPATPVRPGQLARISGQVRVPRTIEGSVDGAMIWDSVGGEMLALRFNTAGAWKPFVMHRPIREAGELRVVLSLKGVGAVQFDDVKIELADDAPLPLAGRVDSPPR